MLCDPEYVDTSDETTPAYDDWREKYRAARESTLTSTFEIMPFEEALRQFLALTDCQRQSDAARSGAADTLSDPIQSPEWAPPSKFQQPPAIHLQPTVHPANPVEHPSPQIGGWTSSP